MNRETVVATLTSLGLSEPSSLIENVDDGSSSLLHTSSGSSVAVLRRGERYDALVLGAEAECPVPSLRAILESAVLPLSDEYAAQIGVAAPERDSVRKRIQEASVALDVIAKGRHFSVAAPKFSIHTEVRKHIDAGVTSVDQLSEDVFSLSVLNKLQACVAEWSREIDKVVQVSKTGPAAVLTIEEEIVFWSSLDAALSDGQQKLKSAGVRVTLDILARRRRATGFLIEANTAVDTARRKAVSFLTLLQGLPIVALRTTEDLDSLRQGVSDLLEHVASKLRVSSISVERVLGLIDSMGSDVSQCVGRVMSGKGTVLTVPFTEFAEFFRLCSKLFDTWEQGFNNCRRIAREVAHKKGETIPPRNRSPLLHLQTHLSEVQELRSDYQDLGDVFHALRDDIPNSKRMLERLDTAYSCLLEECSSVDHFQVVGARGSTWSEARSVYRSRVTVIENSVKEAYQEATHSGSSIPKLSSALHPFRYVLEKDFLSSAIAEAIPIIVEMGRKDLCTLQKRETALDWDKARKGVKHKSSFTVLLSQCALLQHRVRLLQRNVKSAVGKTQVEFSADLREFLYEAEQLEQRVNPAHRLTAWLRRVDRGVFNSNVLSVSRTFSKYCCVTDTLGKEGALFCRILSFAKGNEGLGKLMPSEYLEFARLTKSLYPSYCNIAESSARYNSFNGRLRQLDAHAFHRMYTFLKQKRLTAREGLERGLSMQWSQPSSKLMSYSSALLQQCTALASSFHSLLERDAVFDNVLVDLNNLPPSFSNGELCFDTKASLTISMRRFNAGLEAFRQSFGTNDANKYVVAHWVPRLRHTLLGFIRRVTSSWASALESGQLCLPTVVMDVNASKDHKVVCNPTFVELERLLYGSIGLAYQCVADALSESKVQIHSRGKTCVIDGKSILSLFYTTESRSDAERGSHVAFQKIKEALQQTRATFQSWSSHVPFLDLAFRSIIEEIGDDVRRFPDILDQITQIYESIISLQRHDLQGLNETAQNSYLQVDSSSLSERLSSKILSILRSFCKWSAVRGSELSQKVYEDISRSKQSIKDASNGGVTDALMMLQFTTEDVLPRCERSIMTLLDLELKYEDVASRLRDRSFSCAHMSESWILSQELFAHFKELQDLHHQRLKSTMVNRELLISKLEENRVSFQVRLRSLFDEFQRIRSEKSPDGDLFSSISALDLLERDLKSLEEQTGSLERCGRALGISDLSEQSGPKAVLVEVGKVKNGIEKLCCVEEKIALLAKSKIRDIDPVSVRGSLEAWKNEVADISKLSGATREGEHLMERLSSYLKVHSTLQGLHSTALPPPRERDLLRRLFGENYPKGGILDTTLDMFWDADLGAHGKYLRTVFENAAAEASICDFLKSIERAWSGRKCVFIVHGGVNLLQGIPSLLDEVDEHIQGLETLGASPHAVLFESERAAWEQKLAKFREDIELLSDVQARWAHLRTLFTASDGSGVTSLRQELEEEFLSFSNVHARFSSLGDRMRGAPGVLEGLETPSGLAEMKNELDGIVRGLSTFLEGQRSRFPRFFFLSDNDLLNVLTVSSTNIEMLIPHVNKVFPGISSFEYKRERDMAYIYCVLSKEGEVLRFPKPVTVSGRESVTAWLNRLLEALTSLLKNTLPTAVAALRNTYKDGIQDVESFLDRYMGFPGQISLLATKVAFTEDVERNLMQSERQKEQLQRSKRVLESALKAVCSCRLLSTSRSTSKARFRLMRDQLIKELIYQRGVLSRLLAAGVTATQCHRWNHELRCYYRTTTSNAVPSEEVFICCGMAEFTYGWEYLGIGETLVHTHLTSRCFLSLCEALRRGLGGSPFGPAGTGKTETVKALGRLLGRFVAVFNCDESFDSVAVGRILAGACRVGSWVCFDEFNRLSASILSSTSGQLAVLQAAIQRGDSVVNNFFGGDLPVAIRRGVGIFVTMNPKYTGRRDLPANLKTLFRPCAMSSPDFLVIVEVLLLSQGFTTSTALSKKLVCLFNYLKATLPSQPHYDFGLRSLKSTVLAGGSGLVAQGNCEGVHPEANEEDTLIRALAEILKPKLESEDIASYHCAIAITFTKATCLSPLLPVEFESVLGEVVSEQRLIADSLFLDKVRELYSLLRHRRGVMLVGPTGSSKTAAWRTLYTVLKRLSARQAQTERKFQPRSSLTVLDPKLLSLKQLYGDLNAVTREWSDGLFTRVLRGLAESHAGEELAGGIGLNWIVFDGDVDPDWIENLNSVLDDNQILTLPTGEQLPLLPNTRILFETESLVHANPSTVSRCGLVRFGELPSRAQMLTSSIGSLAKEFCPGCQLPSSLSDIMLTLLEISKEVVGFHRFVMDIPLESLFNSVLQFMRVALQGLNGSNSNGSVTSFIFLRTFIVGAVKCVSAGLKKVDQKDISRLFLEKLGSFCDVQEALAGIDIPCNLAEVTVTQDGTYRPYSELVTARQDLVRPEEIGSPDVVIPTPTTIKLESFLQHYLGLKGETWRRPSPLILCGPPGSGKSMILSAALREIPNISLSTLSFSSATSPAHILAALRAHTVISKRPNGTYCLHPKSTGCRVVLFCDEVNLQKPDEYNTQSSICFLRTLAEQGGFWYGDSPEWVAVEGVQLVAACNPAHDSGRHELSQRFLRHCCVVRVEVPDAQDLEVIYRVFVDSLLREVHPALASKADALTSAMIEFFVSNKEQFSPEHSGPLQPHYIYSPRDLSRWLRGLKQLLNLHGSQRSQFGRSLDVEMPLDDLWNDVISAVCYEGRRVFCDRLLRKDEQVHAEGVLSSAVRKHLHTLQASDTDLLYTSWLEHDEDNVQIRRFRIVDNVQNFRTLIYRKLRVFAEEEGLGGSWMGGTISEDMDDSSAMIDQFAVTDDVLTHLTRIERVLSQPLGHAVLMGASGTGKKTLARFAAWMLSIEVHQVYSHSSYTEQDFANDLRKILRRAGVDRRQVLIVFDESNALDSAFLEMMNSILACGEVPGLYAGDERIRLLEDLRTRGAASTSSITTEQALYGEFVKQVRSNLHIIFTISTGCAVSSSESDSQNVAGGDIAERSPALYNRCTVDWIGDWSKETLEAVAELKIEVALGQEKDHIIRCAVEIHEIAKANLKLYGVPLDVTPRHYLEFIEQINRIALEKGSSIQRDAHRHTEGLRRLEAAGNAVDDLKDALSEKSEHLQQKEARANATLSEMVDEQRRAEKSKVAAEQLALAAQEASQTVQDREAEVIGQLSEVEPKITAAREAVGSIRKEYLEELRAMPNPPSGVRIALEGVLMLLDATNRKSDVPYTWGHIRTRMRGSDFITSIVNFDTDALPSGVRSRVETRILQNPDFDVNRISYASRAAGPLAEWTLAVFDYAAVKEAVEPLQKEVTMLREEQVELLDRQDASLQEVENLQGRIEECRRTYASLIAEAERVRQEIQESEKNLVRAEAILSSLDEEFRRWVKELNALNDAAVTMWGNAVHAAAFVAYAGVLDHISRSALSEKWKKVLLKENIRFDKDKSLTSFLTSTEERGLWSARGLPTDETSIENYAILKRSARFPLLVNPSRQSAKMLQNILLVSPGNGEAANRPIPDETARLRINESSFAATGKKSYMRALESSMRFGTAIVLEDAERFDRAVAPLLGQESTYGDASEIVQPKGEGTQESHVGRLEDKQRTNIYKRIVRLGDRDVFLSPSFRLFLSTAYLRAVPRAAVSRSNVVSFEMSPAALNSSAILRAMHILLPQLEAKRKASLVAKVEYEKRKEVLEREVLSAITDVKDLKSEILGGSLLDSLSALKEEAMELETHQRDELHASLEVKHTESLLVSLGQTAVDAFTVVQSLAMINTAYMFHIKFFMAIFAQAVREGSGDSDRKLEDKIIDCQRAVLRRIYTAYAPSLFPKDRVPFASALALASVACNSDEKGSRDAFQDIRHTRLRMRSILKVLERGAVLSDADRGSELALMPLRLRERVTTAQLHHDEGQQGSLLDCALRIVSKAASQPELILGGVDNLACTLPGGRELIHGSEAGSESALYSVLSNFAKRQSRQDGKADMHFTPLFLLARGENSDPATLTSEFANTLDLKIVSITMGSGNEDTSITDALSVAAEKSRNGTRALLLIKNMHLAGRKATELLQAEITKRNGLLPTLLVVTGETSTQFSSAMAGVAPLCRLVAFESPPTFRENFRSSLDMIASLRSRAEVKWPYEINLLERLHISISWLHAAILERALHAPVGFTRPYEFSHADLLSAWDVVGAAASTSTVPEVYLCAVAQLLVSVVYGCRLEDDTDLDILIALSTDVFFTKRLLTPANESSVVVLQNDDPRIEIGVPCKTSERTDFVHRLPSEAPPAWSHMPPDAGKRMHIAEGIKGLRKVLQISDKKFCAGDENKPGKALTTVGSNAKVMGSSGTELDELHALAGDLPKAEKVEVFANQSTPFQCYLKTESATIAQVIACVEKDIIAVVNEGKSKDRKTQRLKQLRVQLLENINLDSRILPAAWFSVCPYFGRDLSVANFFAGVKAAGQEIQKLATCHDEVDLSALLRPGALLEALRAEEAGRMQASPHLLELAITGDPNHGGKSYLLKGVRMNRVRWDSSDMVFRPDPSGNETSRPLWLRWASEENCQNEHRNEVSLPLYGRGSRELAIAKVRVPAAEGSSLPAWRLCGASLSINSCW